jgi:hypothetical protein
VSARETESATEDGEAFNHEQFFKQLGDCEISARYYDVRYPVTVEALYQAFRARLKAEG